ncbi:hypothetical protein Pmani_039612 [Petrolisthes manimaculis]|uniref:Uncharacterized protein n=1 Tax=Petrolisthes manimaculis TaxID=1843537 RepID=A0AAE1TJ52_9EUCA|nr:hypothetical protein Pmani_039612 [Petrolisthes manimaculis]
MSDNECTGCIPPDDDDDDDDDGGEQWRAKNGRLRQERKKQDPVREGDHRTKGGYRVEEKRQREITVKENVRTLRKKKKGWVKVKSERGEDRGNERVAMDLGKTRRYRGR